LINTSPQKVIASSIALRLYLDATRCRSIIVNRHLSRATVPARDGARGLREDLDEAALSSLGVSPSLPMLLTLRVRTIGPGFGRESNRARARRTVAQKASRFAHGS
jgi:hypothetical protein